MKRRTRMFSPMLGDGVRDQLADRLVGVPEGLLVQHHLLVPLAQLALHDLLADGLRLGGHRLVGEQLGALALGDLGRDGLDGHVLGRDARDLHRELAHELLEVLVAGHEVGLAVDLDEHAQAAAGMDVRGHEALAGVPAGLLGGGSHAPLAEQGDGLVQVAAGLLERTLAVHEPGPGALAELLDQFGLDGRLVSHVYLDPFVSGAPCVPCSPADASLAAGRPGTQRRLSRLPPRRHRPRVRRAGGRPPPGRARS